MPSLVGSEMCNKRQEMQYLLVPEGMEAPEDLAEGIAVLQQPVDHIYLVASAVMDMFVSMDALDSVRFSGLQESGWYIEEARDCLLYASDAAVETTRLPRICIPLYS